MDESYVDSVCVGFYQGEEESATCRPVYTVGLCSENYGIELEATDTSGISGCDGLDYNIGSGTSDPVYSPLVPVELENYWKKYEITLDVPDIDGKVIGNNGDDYLGVYFWTHMERSNTDCPEFQFRALNAGLNTDNTSGDSSDQQSLVATCNVSVTFNCECLGAGCDCCVQQIVL